jgi:hypothetical protein
VLTDTPLQKDRLRPTQMRCLASADAPHLSAGGGRPSTLESSGLQHQQHTSSVRNQGRGRGFSFNFRLLTHCVWRRVSPHGAPTYLCCGPRSRSWPSSRPRRAAQGSGGAIWLRPPRWPTSTTCRPRAPGAAPPRPCHPGPRPWLRQAGRTQSVASTPVLLLPHWPSRSPRRLPNALPPAPWAPSHQW